MMKLATKPFHPARLGLSALGLTALGLAGCSQSSAPVDDFPSLILGDWICNGAMREDGMKATYTVDVSYNSDGTVRGIGDMNMSGDGLKITGKMDLLSTWDLSGKLLTETLVSIDVSDMEISGEAVTPLSRQIFEDTVREGLETDESLQPGEVSNSSIDLLNDTTMKVTDLDEGSQLTCNRKG